MDLCKMLDEQLEFDNKKYREEHGERKSHYPSELCDCKRKIWYKWKNWPESNPIEGNHLLKMAIGNVIHDFLFSVLAKKGIQIEQEIEFKEKVEGSTYPISGRIDYLFVDLDGGLTGVEVKTTSGYGTDAIIKANYPKPEHLSQVGIYTSCTEVKRFIILYADQQKGWKKQFNISNIEGKIYVEGAPYEGFRFDKVKSDIKQIEANLQSMDPPARDFKIAIVDGVIKDKFTKDKVDYKSQWNCMYCQYLNTCWELVIEKAKEGKWYGEDQIA